MSSVDQEAWADALVSEVGRYGRLLGRRPLTSIFFGGGTPSLMPASTVGAVIDAATNVFAPANDLEVTLEANPSSVEVNRFSGYKSAGVNRVSLGVQSLRDKDLKVLGRLHSAEEARSAIGVAQSRFDRVSFDLIYARQNQSSEDWETELSEAIAIGTNHLSLYQLTIEPGTAFGTRFAAGGLRGLPDEGLGADLYELTNALCAEAGLPAYETSNHARRGAECRHNLIYWHGGDYAGVGPGAHGRLTLDGERWATEAKKMPADWLSAVSAGGDVDTQQMVPRETHCEELVMMGLRTTQGIDLERLRRAGLVFPKDKLEEMVRGGWMEIEGSQLRASPLGRLVLNAILRELLT